MRNTSSYFLNPQIYINIFNSLKTVFPLNIFKQHPLLELPYQNLVLRVSTAFICTFKQSFSFSPLLQQIFIEFLASVSHSVPFLGYNSG